MKESGSSKRVVVTVPGNVPGFLSPMYCAGDQVLMRRVKAPRPGDVAVGIPKREGLIDYFSVAGVFCGGKDVCDGSECDGFPEGCLVPINRKLPPFRVRDLCVIGVIERKLDT